MKKAKINRIIYIWILLLALFTGMTMVAGSTSPAAGLVFLLFQILFILLPGAGVLAVLGIKPVSKLELVSFSYGIGYAVNIITYYLIMLSGIKEYAVWVLCLEAFLAAAVLYKKKDCLLTLEEDTAGNIICGVMLVILFLCRFFLYFGVNKIPSAGEANFYTADLMYYIGNSVEMAKECPPMDFRWHIQPYKYHLFGSAQMALLQMVVKIPMVMLEFSYGFIQPCMLLVFSIYSLLKRMGLKKEFCALGLSAILFMTGWEEGTFCTYAAHMLIVPFGFDIGLAYMLLSVLFYILYLREQKINVKILSALLIFTAACTGAKGPFAVVLIGAIGIDCAYRFLVKRAYKQTLAVGLSMLGVFLLIFFGVISEGFNTVNGGNGLGIKPLGIVLDSRVGGAVLRRLPASLPEGIRYGLTAILYLIMGIPGLGMLPVMVFAVRKKINRDILEKNLIFLYLIVIGVILGLFTSQSGYSQMYFLFAGIPFVAVLVVKALSGICGRHKNRVTWGIAAVILLLGIYGCCQYKGYYKTGLDNLTKGTGTGWQTEQPNLVTYEEYEAYEWIRKNTDEDSLLVSNVMLRPNHGRSFVTGAFSERHLWLEGWEYGYVVRSVEEVSRQQDITARAMENDAGAIETLISEGVDYLVQIKQISPGFRLDTQFGSPVFENNGVCIYQLSGIVYR